MNTSAATSNPSLATRTYGQIAESMSNSHNVAAAPSTRSFELAALYGIPHSLPKPPKTTARPETTPAAQSFIPPMSFEALRQNYLSMLSNDPSATMAEPSSGSLPAEGLPNAVGTNPLPPPSSGDTEFIDIDIVRGDLCSLNHFAIADCCIQPLQISRLRVLEITLLLHSAHRTMTSTPRPWMTPPS